MNQSYDKNPAIGFCCKWLDKDGLSDPMMNQRITTMKSLLGMPLAQRGEKIEAITVHNMTVLRNQLTWLSGQPMGMRLFRITSQFVPASCHPLFKDIHESSSFRNLLSELAWVRPFADEHGIRLCTHPGQFSNLCSKDEAKVGRAILDIEYHADLAVLMGYGTGWHPSGFAINVHGNVNLDPGLTRFKNCVLNRFSTEARNLLTIENDEFSCGVDDLIANRMHEVLPMVLDIHHHWIRSEGENIEPSDSRIAMFQESWRGTRPLSHASLSKEELVGDWPRDVMPDYRAFNAMGLKPRLLQGHSRLIWNDAAMEWICRHLEWTDIEIESKGKNLASRDVWEYAHARGIA